MKSGLLGLLLSIVFSPQVYAYGEYCWGVNTSTLKLNVPQGSPIVGATFYMHGYYGTQVQRNFYVGVDGTESTGGCPDGTIPMNAGNSSFNFKDGGWWSVDGNSRNTTPGSSCDYDGNCYQTNATAKGGAAQIVRCWEDWHWETFNLQNICVSGSGAIK